MKKLTLILAAFALTFGFSQCKKAETPTTTEGVYITLTAGYGQNGAKTDFNPVSGAFEWTGSAGNLEYINVGGNSSGYLGQLTSTQSGATVEFSGTITPGAEDTQLYFFYLGNGNHALATTLDFSNQDGTLGNVTNYHIAISDGIEYTGQTSFSATLNMKMAIAYFDVSGFKKANETAETVYLHGDEVYTTATIDYQTGTITGDAKGYLNMGTANAGKYVALIPSTTEQTTLKFDSDSKTGAMTFLRGIQAGRYYSNSGAALTVTAGALLAGTIPGLFSVSATKMVRFSKGNLQYNKTDSEWSFMANQYDIVEPANQNVGTNYANWSVVSLFGWGTGNNPTCTSGDSGDYSNFDEWGNNAIVNGGNTPNSGWRTPTSDEWHYLFSSSERGSKRFFYAKVHDCNGVIVFPDNYAGTGLTGSYTYNTSGYQSVVDADWAKMEAVGAAFLPAAGMRNGTVVNSDVGKDGAYWSSTYGQEVYFNKGDGLDDQFATGNLKFGQSVRLVRDVQ